MRHTFAAFLEMIFFDATYKLLELQYPVYLFICEDSNGSSEIIGTGLLVTEDAESMKLLIETFKEKNPCVENTRLAIADKDLNRHDVIKKILPQVKVLIYIFLLMIAVKFKRQYRKACF